MSKLEDFVNIAVSKKGMLPNAFQSWANSLGTPFNSGQWCADFVWACAKYAGLIGTVFTGSSSANGFVSDSYRNHGGEIYSVNSSYTPVVGDLVNFTGSGHIGIVTACNGSTVSTIEGNTDYSGGYAGGRVLDHNFSRNYQKFSRFYHPNWSLAGDGSGASFIWGDLYENKNTREDAIVREVLYEQNNQLTGSATRDRISVGNYTDVFSELWDWGKTMLTPVYSAEGLEGNARVVVQFFIDKGLTAAAGCGVAGNIKHESSFNTASIGDYGTSFGICQWHLGRGANMKQFCGGGDAWKTNLTGQLEYLWYELNSSYKVVLSAMQSAGNTESDARHVADVFVRRFEIPANVDYQSTIRQNSASEYFNSLTFSIGHPLARGSVI